VQRRAGARFLSSDCKRRVLRRRAAEAINSMLGGSQLIDTRGMDSGFESVEICIADDRPAFAHIYRKRSRNDTSGVERIAELKTLVLCPP
jgi:hypothetical protein